MVEVAAAEAEVAQAVAVEDEDPEVEVEAEPVLGSNETKSLYANTALELICSAIPAEL